MTTTLAIAFFALGTVIASGVNALAYRRARTLPWGGKERSQCPHCGKTLSAAELVPLVSFAFQGGSCSGCGEPISARYPLVELAGGGLFLLAFVEFGLTINLFFALPAMGLLLFMYIYDATTLTLPNPAVWSFNLLAFLSLFVTTGAGLSVLSPAVFVLPTWWALAAGPLVSLPFLALWLGSRGRAMGFGDVKLALGIGWFLGLLGGLSAVMYSFWIGAVISLGILGAQRLAYHGSSKEDREGIMKLSSAVPFGPFLLLGFMLVYFGQITLF